MTTTEKLIGFVGKRVTILSDLMAKDGKPSLITRSRHSEALLIFRELQDVRKAERAKAKRREPG